MSLMRSGTVWISPSDGLVGDDLKAGRRTDIAHSPLWIRRPILDGGASAHNGRAQNADGLAPARQVSVERKERSGASCRETRRRRPSPRLGLRHRGRSTQPELPRPCHAEAGFQSAPIWQRIDTFVLLLTSFGSLFLP